MELGVQARKMLPGTGNAAVLAVYAPLFLHASLFYCFNATAKLEKPASLRHFLCLMRILLLLLGEQTSGMKTIFGSGVC